ncbi:L-alanine exporter AlaE [Patescibacteria group bacterium]
MEVISVVVWKAVQKMSTRKFWLDGVAMTIFFCVLITLVEYYIIEIPLKVSLKARAIFAPKPLIGGGFYGIARDTILSKVLPLINSGLLKLIMRWVIEAVLLLAFKAPLYIISLLIFGAEIEQIIKSSLLAGAGLILVAIPFGIYFEGTRRGQLVRLIRWTCYKLRLRKLHRYLFKLTI